MSALTAAAAERIERELARHHEKTEVAYMRHWQLVRDTPDPSRLGANTVRRFHECHDQLRLHQVLGARFGPTSPRGHAPQAERIGELVTYVMTVLAVSNDTHGEDAAKDLLAVILEAMDTE